MLPGSYDYCDDSDLGITHEDGEDTAEDVVSTFPFAGGNHAPGTLLPWQLGELQHPGDGNPAAVIVRKPRP